MTNTSNKADFKTVKIDTEGMLQPNKYDMNKDCSSNHESMKCSATILMAIVSASREEFQYLRYGDRYEQPDL